MSGRSIRLAVGLLGTLWAVTGESIAMSQGRPASVGLLHLAIGLTYVYGGLAIWDHEPANRTGRLMTLVGLTWFIGTLNASDPPIVRELALGLEDTTTVLLLALVLAYPSGRLETLVDRVAVAILAIGATSLNILYSTSLTLIADKSSGLYGGLALATLSTVVVVRRWLIAPPRTRRELAPVLVAGMVFLAALIINLIRRIADLPEGVEAILLATRDLAPAAIPIALLVGFYRQSERRLQALVDAIPDRMFRFARDGRFVGAGSGDMEADATTESDDLIGRRLHELMFAEASEAALVSADRALESGELQAYDFSLDLPTGKRAYEARIAPSGPAEVTAIVRDFTDQRAAEVELRRSRARIVEARRGAAQAGARPPRRRPAAARLPVARPAPAAHAPRVTRRCQ
jgi:PAS domain-containing protein